MRASEARRGPLPVASFDDLRAAEIVVSTTNAAPAAAAMLPWPEQFTAPVLERYDDIAKIIAMDPIHDVGPGGWPQPAGNLEV